MFWEVISTIKQKKTGGLNHCHWFLITFFRFFSTDVSYKNSRFLSMMKLGGHLFSTLSTFIGICTVNCAPAINELIVVNSSAFYLESFFNASDCYLWMNCGELCSVSAAKKPSFESPVVKCLGNNDWLLNNANGWQIQFKCTLYIPIS